MGQRRQKKSRILNPREAMQLAIEEAYKGAGFVSPNPLVGCVVLDEEFRLLSTGYHKMYGGDHAEVEALKGVSQELLQGAHIFVTLEPCAHEGKTPSCARMLAKHRLGSVTYGLRDPNPLVDGKGAQMLSAVGIKVEEFSELKSELEELSEHFLHNVRTGYPFVALKVASSLDGQMALKNGQSQWITNEVSRERVHYLRGYFDAVVVGRRTIEIDNPRLNIRSSKFPEKQNRVVILDPSGEILKDLKDKNVFKVHRPEDITIVVSEGAKVLEEPCAVLRVAFDEHKGFDLSKLLLELKKLGHHSLMLEGGAHVYQTFLNQKFVNRLYYFQAPMILGAQQGLSWTQGFGIERMEDRILLKRPRTELLDGDILITGLIST